VLKIAVVILVRLRVHDHGIIDPSLGHAPQEVFGSGGIGGLIGSLRMVGETIVVLSCEAVEMGVDHRGAEVGRAGMQVARQQWQSGGLEEPASLHGGFLTAGRHSLIQKSARVDTPTQGITRAGLSHREHFDATELPDLEHWADSHDRPIK
jgi:hypothetical protein